MLLDNLAEEDGALPIDQECRWIVCLVGYYSSKCSFYPGYIKYWNATRTDYYPYTYAELSEIILTPMIGTPLLVFLLGALALRVGRWIAKGFRPSQSQAGE